MPTEVRRRCSLCHEDFMGGMEWGQRDEYAFAYCPYDGGPIEEYEHVTPVRLTKLSRREKLNWAWTKHFAAALQTELESARSLLALDFARNSYEDKL